MQQLPLIGGSYAARSVIANAQRCLNLFPEINREDSPTKMTHYQRPGLAPQVSPGSPAIGRGMYQASNGDGDVVIGTTLYYVDPSWSLHSLGSILTDNDNTSIVSMVDNGIQLIIVSGFAYAGNATGYFTFMVNPTAGDTATFNGVVYTFVASATSGTNIHIGGSLGLTMLSLQTQLQASTNPLITQAIYALNDSGGNKLVHVTSKLPGAAGTAYTLAASVATPSHGTLQWGAGVATVLGPGWTVDLGDLTGSTFVAITDASWTGADRVDFLDTFIVWNVPGSTTFGSTLSNSIVPLDATYFASKTTWPDPLLGVIVCQGQLMLAGTLKSELWYDAGNATFPFARLQGVSIEHGVIAKYSLANSDLDIFWLSADLQGNGLVLRLRGNDVKRISNFALEYAISQMVTISDAVGYTYLKAGHTFYVLSFPSANQTWVWDASVNDPQAGWHQRGWTDLNGGFNRDRGVLGAVFYGKNVVLDWENGTIYEQSNSVYTDTVLGREYPILFLRTFPHLMAGTDPASGQPILANGKVVQHNRFAIDVECGNAADLSEPKFTLRYSDDRGATWDGTVLIAAGKKGQYGTRPDVRTLGQAMDRVYEVSWSFPGKVALNGAWVEGVVTNQ